MRGATAIAAGALTTAFGCGPLGSPIAEVEIDEPILAAPQGGPDAAQLAARTPRAQAPASAVAPDSLTALVVRIGSELARLHLRLDSMAAADAVPAAAGSVAAEPELQDAAAPGADAVGLDLEGARDEVRSLGVGIAWSIVVIVVFHFAIRALIWLLETLAERSATRRLTFKRLVPITRMLLWAIAAYLIVRTIFRVDAQGLLAAGAALGVVLGFAAQDLLKNVFGGLIVVFDQPFQVGDKVAVGGAYGEVASIGLRSTRIVTADDNLVTVPNSQVVQEQVANANSGQLHCQVPTSLHLPGRVDERLAKRIAYDAAVTSPYVFLGKPVAVFVEDEFRTTFVTRVKVRAYVLDPRFEFRFRSDVTERARDGFRAAGLAPERDWPPWAPAADATAG